MTRFVTVSGIVGSGKSTIAQKVVEHLELSAIPAVSVRFQSLPCFRGIRGRRSPTAATRSATRWLHYRRRPLGLRHVVGYIARIIAFRIYVWRLPNDRVYVFNRYFYDTLVHFESRRHRLWRFMLRLTPVPDLPILTTASGDTITRRRPDYSAEYIVAAGAAYAELAHACPELVEVRTEQMPVEGLPELLRARLNTQNRSATE